MIDAISIIVPALNEEKYISILLDSLAKQTFAGKMEVILVDGNSVDKTIAVAQGFADKLSDFTIIASKKRGISLQRNLGAQKAKYHYLLFLDADMYLPKDLLKKIAQKVNSSEQFVGTVNEWLINPTFLDTILSLLAYPFVVAAFFIEKYLPGFFILTTKDTHEKIHGFDETITLAEDLDYAKRAIKAGAKYHFYFTLFARLSLRRVRKMGYIKFFRFLLLTLLHTKRHGAATVAKRINGYTFGEHSA